MSAVANKITPQPEAAAVLSKAVTRAAERLNLSRSQLAKVLGVSLPTISRLYNGSYLLEQSRKEWEFALLFVRLFRSLDSIVGDAATAQKWLQSQNLGLNGRPIELIGSIEGLVLVVQYLDASRSLI
jgi:transcriptional regulator with XRE-family HTH domain